MKRKRTNWKKVEAQLNAIGIPTPAQAKKIKVIKDFQEKHFPDRTNILSQQKAPFELSLNEFIQAFGKSALELTEFNSVRDAYSLLKSAYISVILDAMKAMNDGIHEEGVDLVRFRPAYTSVVKPYLKEKKIQKF